MQQPYRNGSKPRLERQSSTTSSRMRRLENWIECRFVLTALFFLGMMNMYMMRANLSVAMVAMVDSKQLARNKNQSLVACNADELKIVADNFPNVTQPPVEQTEDELHYQNSETFEWDSPTRGWILGAFYYGYMTTQIIGGFLEHKFGGKIVFGGAVFMSSLLSMLTPTMARMGPWYLMATRVLLGVSQGPMYPVHHGMWGKWAPPMARSKLISITMTGTNIGTALSYNLSGYLARHGFAGGWPSVFYVMGIIGFCWVILWAIFAYDSPAKHPRISERERRYIEQSIGTHYKQDEDMPKIPWRGIFTSPIFWGLFIGHFCSNYGHYNLLTNLPSYIDQVFGLSIKDNSALAAIPFISLWFFTTLAGWIADSIRETKRLSTLNVRRILIVIAQFVPAIFLVSAGYLGCNPAAAILVVTLAAGFGGFATPGFKVCHVEIAPRYSGILYSLTNTFATISGQVVGPIAGYVTGNVADVREAWRIVYYVGAAVSALGGFVVLATLKTDVQSWARIDEDFYELEDEKKKKSEAFIVKDDFTEDAA
uniref:sialin-like n=1 Tax=Ciona intestinalis TaxID=7719 RepID=UPI00006A501A|nr:sialin-like [Ciona intestinalis]|eukprot:XP_002131022.1 sialin-like [Ciona intestinalis]